MKSDFFVKRGSPRELRVYRTLLSAAEAPALLGAADGWLFLQRLDGEHPDFDSPAEAAEAYEWLGRLHRRFLGLDWRALPGRPPGMPWPAAFQRLAAILGPELAAVLSAGPRTLVHGDFHRWNLLKTEHGLRAVDWEHAACAHPVWDLLLLAPGEPAREDTPAGPAAWAALAAYHAAGPLAGLPYGEFLRLQAGARLFVATVRLSRHRRLAAALPPGPASVAEQYAQVELERVNRLKTQVIGSTLCE